MPAGISAPIRTEARFRNPEVASLPGERFCLGAVAALDVVLDDGLELFGDVVALQGDEIGRAHV